MGFPSPLRRSHLQPASAQPPPSFGRQAGSTFRENLRRIPSSIFSRADQPKKGMERKGSLNKLNEVKVASVRAVPPEVKVKGEKERKPKTRTRKALGELFGWGNSSSAPASPPRVISPPSPLRRSPPGKPPTLPTKDIPFLRKPAVLTRKASSNTFGTATSNPAPVRAPLRALALKHQPVIGEDPFSRGQHGAEVIQQVPKQATSAKSDYSAERRRDSIHSSKAMSTKTAAIDEFSSHETAMRARMSSPRQVTMAHVIEEKKRISNTPPRKASTSTLNAPIVPPPRCDSLPHSAMTRELLPAARVRVNDAPVYDSTPAPMPVIVPALVDRTSMQGMRKEKIKSKAWGVFGSKIGRMKDDKVSEVKGSVGAVNRPLILGNSIQLLRHGISRPNISAPICSPPFQPSMPILHVSRPSIDASSAGFTDSPSPKPTWINANSLIVDTPSQRDSGSTIASFTDFKAAMEETKELGDGAIEQCAQLLAGPKILPKRKSLNGLFGLSIKGKASDFQAPASARSFGSEHSAFQWTPPKLRPLSEEIELTFGSFKGGFGRDAASQQSQKAPDPSLRRVASATDKLLNLVSTFDFSPAASPAKARLAPVTSFTSLRKRISASPTPIRKTKSAMIFSKANSPTPPTKPSSISPIKNILHRAHVRKMDGVHNLAREPENDVPPPSSLVRKGMRNPFAPPSPKRGSGQSIAPAEVSQSLSTKRARSPIALGPAMGLAGFMDERTVLDDEGDVPADLKAILKGLDVEIAVGSSRLPKPQMGRVARRRPARAAPKISLPPVPPLPPANPSTLSPDSIIPRSDNQYFISTATRCGPESRSATPDKRQSFDFTGEYEELDRGAHRASFVEALHRMNSSDMFSALPPLPPLPSGPLYTIEQSPESVRTIRAAGSSAEGFADAVEPYVSPARVRKTPFQGTFAFQQQIHKHSPPVEEPPHDVPEPSWKSHQRDVSGLSIATLSSVGDVLDTAETAREYTNYFEANFSKHLAVSATRCSRTVCTDSANEDPRAPTRRAHHRRNSSIISVESIGIVGQVLSTGLPPNSLFNNVRRSGYVSKHRRDGSSDSAFGRSDWASHRRSISGDSTSSVSSVMRIARPAGPSERMFQLDNSVRLTSITGSPGSAIIADHAEIQSWDSVMGMGEAAYDTASEHVDPSFETLFARSSQSNGINRYSVSSTSMEKRSSGSSDSVFGADPAVIKQAFLLRGMRPISAVSSGMDSESGEDTFLNAKRYIMRGAKEECYEGLGEDRMTPLHESCKRSTGHFLSESISRPAKPQSARRRRPTQLNLAADPDTPGLTSPSMSETSSRLSLETRFSSERGMGHHRQKSSANVYLHATIKEEISMATLRAPARSSASPRIRIQLSRENLRRQDARALESEEEDNEESTESITAWLRFQREAHEVCRRGKSEFRDSIESRAAVAEFQGRFSPQSVADFLAESAASYKPLAKAMPAPRDQAHRRKASLSDARALTSPYGLPLPKPHGDIPRGSLTTKFERSKSAAPTRMSNDPTSLGTPVTGIFAHLMLDLVPQLANSAPILSPGKLSPFAQSLPIGGDVFNLAGPGSAKEGKLSAPPRVQPLCQKSGENQFKTAESRTRVDSGTRRKALGWSRRRNSDEPELAGVVSKVVPLTRGLGPRAASGVLAAKENTFVPPVPGVKSQHKDSTRKGGAVRTQKKTTGLGAGAAMRV